MPQLFMEMSIFQHTGKYLPSSIEDICDLIKRYLKNNYFIFINIFLMYCFLKLNINKFYLIEIGLVIALIK